MGDEVYLQVMKQLTDNPSAWSEKAGWELFKVLINRVLPSRRLQDFVQMFLQKNVKNDGEEEERNIKMGPRRALSRQLTLAFYKENRPHMTRELLGILGARLAA